MPSTKSARQQSVRRKRASGRQSLVHQAYQEIRRRILDNEYPPAHQVLEQDLAADLGMSRTPMREALVRLQNEHFIQLIPRHGMRVVPLSLEDLRDTYEVLTALELTAIERLVRANPDRRALAPLERALDDMDAALKQRDRDAWVKADERFHRTLIDLCGNSRLAAVAYTLWDHGHRARMTTVRLRPTLGSSNKEHRDVVEAIKRGDWRESKGAAHEASRPDESGNHRPAGAVPPRKFLTSRQRERPVGRGSARDLRTKTKDTVSVQTSDIGGAQVVAAKSNTGDMLQPRAWNRAKMFCAHLPSHECLFHRVDMGRIRLFEDGVQRVSVESPQSVADQAGHPHPSFLIERESVGPASMPERQHDLGRLERPLPSHWESSQAPPERLHDVQPLAAGIGAAFVRIVQTVGHDTGSVLVDQHHEPVCHVGTPGELPRAASRADGDPRSAMTVDSHEICRRQRHAVDFEEPRRERALLVEPPYSARVPQIRQQERAVWIQRDGVGTKLETGIAREPGLLAAVGANDGNAAVPVGNEHVACLRAEHALRTMEALSERLERRRQRDDDRR